MKLSAYAEVLVSNRDFRRLWIAQLISLGGDWFNTVALLGLVLDITDSGVWAAAVIAASLLPLFLFAPIAGAVADRFDRRKLMIIADLARVLLALGMLLVRSPGTLWIGIVCQLGIAVFGTFFQPASGAALPNLVTPAQLGPANGLMGASWGTMLAVGAALGGIVAAKLGRDSAFIINAVTFLVSATFILRVNGRFSEGGATRTLPHPLRDVKEGFDYARSDPRLIALLATKAGFGIGVGVIALLPLMAKRVFSGGDLAIGLLFGARGLGAMLGPLAASAFVGDNERRLFLAIGASMGLYGVAYFFLPAMPVIGLAAVLATIAHLGGGSQWILSTFGVQKMTPDYIRGRIIALDLGLVGLSMSVSTLAAGRLADSFDPRSVMVIFAGLEITYAVAWTISTRRFWRRSGTSVTPAEEAT